MKVINISGDNQSGRTRALIDFLHNQVMDFDSNCIVVLPTQEEADRLRNIVHMLFSADEYLALKYFLSRVKFVSYKNFNKECVSCNYDLIAFDGIEQFNKNDEGCYKMLASSRLLTKKFGTLVYTSDGKNFRVKHWVSQAVWYKPWTWSNGYYTQDVEL